MRKTLLENAVNPAHFHLIILPTEKCNFRCTYCYEDYQKGRMNEKTLNAIKELIGIRAPDLELFSIEFFGGEPMLEEDIVSDLLTHSSTLAKKYGFHFFASATTNFYLLDKHKIRDLSFIGMKKYHVTLDGDRDFHNQKRFIHNPKGSFDKIWENLLSYNHLKNTRQIDTDINNFGRILLRLHLHPENQASLLALSHKISTNLNPRNFMIILRGISHLGGKNDQNFQSVDEQETLFEARVNELQQILKDFSFSTTSLDSDDPYICYAAKPNTLAIRADGSLAKCTVALDAPENNIGTLQQDGSLHFHPEHLTKWLQAFQTLDDKILSCPIHFVKKTQQKTASAP